MRILPALGWILTVAAMAQTPDADFRIAVVNDLILQNNELSSWPEDGRIRKPADAYRQYQESLAVSASQALNGGDSLALGLTLRLVNYYQQTADATLATPDGSVYRKYLKYSSGGFSLLAGDFYAQLGRGLVLSVEPIDPLLEERTISGGDLHYQGRWLEFRALAGEVRTEARDQAWKVEGGELVLKYLQGPAAGINTIGIHAVRIEDVATGLTQPFQLSLMRQRTLESASAGGDNVGHLFNYYFESARLNWQHLATDAFALDPGRATYGNLILHSHGLFVMGEYRSYLGFSTDIINAQNTLNNPPLADRDNEENNLNHSDSIRILTQYAFHEPDVAVFASAGRIRENDNSTPGTPGFQYDPRTDCGHNVFAGITAEDLFDRLTISAIYGIENIHYPERRTDGSAMFRFTPHWSLEFKLRDLRYHSPIDDSLYRESDYNLQLACSPRFSIYAMHQYRTDPGLLFAQNQFNSGGIRINFGHGCYLDLSGGAVRGGLVCSGGQCREMPDFKGLKLATHMVF
jgi:hypothetical protein